LGDLGEECEVLLEHVCEDNVADADEDVHELLLLLFKVFDILIISI
jgi:hypothetical protein